MRQFFFICVAIFLFSCKNPKSEKENLKEISPENSISSNDSADVDAIAMKDFREFKVLDSKYINVEDLWAPFNADLEDFTEDQYNSLKSLVLERDIPTLQKEIREGQLSYENLVKFYLYRIRKFDRENDMSLNSVIALNPNIISEARQKDRELLNRKLKPPIF